MTKGDTTRDTHAHKITIMILIDGKALATTGGGVTCTSTDTHFDKYIHAILERSSVWLIFSTFNRDHALAALFT